MLFGGEQEPEDRWGAFYAVLAVFLDAYLRRGIEFEDFILDVLAILPAAFIGPFVARLASGLLRRHWEGLTLGGATWLACLLATLLVRLIFAAFR